MCDVNRPAPRVFPETNLADGAMSARSPRTAGLVARADFCDAQARTYKVEDDYRSTDFKFHDEVGVVRDWLS